MIKEYQEELNTVKIILEEKNSEILDIIQTNKNTSDATLNLVINYTLLIPATKSPLLR